MQILVTGFEPFGGSTINPSEQTVRALEGEVIGGARIVAAILPVDWQKGPEILIQALQTHHPDAVLCLGEASERSALSIERVAINLLDFTIPDNSGAAITDQPVIPGAPDAYFVTLPVRAMLQAVKAAGVPAELSLTAGAYLCNETLFHLLHYLAGQNQPVPGGFIHLPRLPQQVAAGDRRMPSMSLDTILTGVRAAIAEIARQLDPKRVDELR